MLCLLSIGGCTASFGPGFAVTRQHVEVTYRLEAPDRLAIQAAYRLKNIGTEPMQAIDVRLPSAPGVDASSVTATWAGATLPATVSPAADSPGLILHAPLATAWDRGQKGDLLVSYNLNLAALVPPGFPANARPIFLAGGVWLPELLPPPGPLAIHPKPPGKWDLQIRLPASYSANASGQEKDENRRGNTSELRFVQQSGEFAPFLAAGPFHERRFKTSLGGVILWTIEPLSDGESKSIAQSAAAARTYFATQFGPVAKTNGKKSGDKQPATWVIECPGALTETSSPPGTPASSCPETPESALLPSTFFLHPDSADEIANLNLQIARTWFGLTL
ncbi:MAG: hypothetical protein ACRD5L_07420, partial [Bryobacteraceae bacterium]